MNIDTVAPRPALEFKWPEIASPFSVVNNRHTVQATVTEETAPHQLSFRGKIYQLRQFHYHRKSEHRIDKENFDFEIHFVHEDVGAPGDFLVVGVFAKFAKDTQSVFTKEIAKLGGLKATDENRYSPMNLPLMPRLLLPGFEEYPAGTASLNYKKEFLTYLGSITTPPCTEKVTWVVLLDPVAVTRADIESIHEARFDNPFENARPPVEVNAHHHEPEIFGASL